MSKAMNKEEAERVGNEVASRYRARPREELLRYLKEQDVFEVVAPSGTRYQIEVQAFWDDRRGKDLRVRIGVDDFGPSAYDPLVVDFIIAPDGSFVGE